MPRYYFVVLITGLGFILASEVYAAEWRECEKTKLRQLDLQQAHRQASPSHTSYQRKKTKQRSESRASVAQPDEWLWQNCREYSYERIAHAGTTAHVIRQHCSLAWVSGLSPRLVWFRFRAAFARTRRYCHYPTPMRAAQHSVRRYIFSAEPAYRRDC